MSDTIADKIAANAIGPKTASGDSGSITQFPIKDLIEADEYAEGRAASRKPGLGIKFNRINPGGTVR